MGAAWKEQLYNKIGKTLFEKYKNAFPASYSDECSASTAAGDIKIMEKLSAENSLEIDFHETQSEIFLKIYQFGKPIPLSDILPILENLDLRTLSERPYQIRLDKEQVISISDFNVVYVKGGLNLSKIKQEFENAFKCIISGQCENDGFNKLILAAQLTWQQATVLRAYTKYLQQIRFRFTQTYIEKTLVNHASISKKLILLFLARNNPKNKHSLKQLKTLQDSIQFDLEKVASLDEDVILRRFLALINATLRTNYFLYKEYLAFKFRSADIPELPLPHPLFEIFVYSTRFEGIHLRSDKVARGGIRWSDRKEDFRTEILGLMKAQRVKNAVIVPSGAKGGFVLKTELPPVREVVEKEVIYCYKSFIHGLLDLTDNLAGNKIIRPAGIVCHDEPDTYLVVAADKGTATFSDIANSISKEYQFWLGDAFASGGSAGYDHKKMGITARGAWESIKRHFRELNIDVMRTDFTAIGIGDMSGDVFGNGMIYTPHCKLVAAFDHRNIFLDPDSDPQISFNERLRLFKLPQSSWEDYNAKLISKGGGVFKRSSKSISISPEIKKILAIEESSLTPDDLIRAILRAPVDLLYNGGIGTYVKSTIESHADVGDKTNDLCRINGAELRCKVVGEGGNLGFTQLGRVEFALAGGLIYTDFIDNSAGVDCSDHEVNIKILLNKEVAKGKLSEAQRNKLLVQMTQEVADLVLQDNYHQALTMSFSMAHAVELINLHQVYIKFLETTHALDRTIEFLPDDRKILERKAGGVSLTRPELAVILAYTKIYVKQEILNSDLPDDAYFNFMLETAFPEKLKKSYLSAMVEHPLKKEIIATQLSNYIVNEMGITFVYRLQTETGAQVAEIVRAYMAASKVFRASELIHLIDSLGFKISISMQYELLYYIRRLLNLSTRWFLRLESLKGNMEKIVQHYSNGVRILENVIPNLMLGVTKGYLESLRDGFVKAGIAKDTANRIAITRAIYTSLNIIEIATRYNFDLIKTAKVYFKVGGQFHLVWFRDQIANDTREGHWNTMARLTLRDELDDLQKKISICILKINKNESSSKKLIAQWVSKHHRIVERWEQILEMVHGSTSVDYSMFFIALRELANLI